MAIQRIAAVCKRCLKPFTLEYEPNEFLTEKFVLGCAICAACEDRKASKLPDRQFINKPESGRLPYPDP